MRATQSAKHRHLTLRIEAEEADRLEALARVNERSVSAEVRRAIRSHLAQQKQAA